MLLHLSSPPWSQTWAALVYLEQKHFTLGSRRPHRSSLSDFQYKYVKKVYKELKTLEWWISKLMLDSLFFLKVCPLDTQIK